MNVRNSRSATAIEKGSLLSPSAPRLFTSPVLWIAHTQSKKGPRRKLRNNYSLVKRTANKQEAWYTVRPDYRAFSLGRRFPGEFGAHFSLCVFTAPEFSILNILVTNLVSLSLSRACAHALKFYESGDRLKLNRWIFTIIRMKFRISCVGILKSEEIAEGN